MGLASELNDFMQGEEAIAGFSGGSVTVIIGLIALSAVSGAVARRFLFPRLMDVFSKTERIDGRDLFAPKSLAWMTGLLVLWQGVDWLQASTTPVWNEGSWRK